MAILKRAAQSAEVETVNIPVIGVQGFPPSMEHLGVRRNLQFFTPRTRTQQYGKNKCFHLVSLLSSR